MPQRIKRYSETRPGLGRNFQSLRRASAPSRGYDRAWQHVANRRRRLDCGLCQGCLRKGLTIAGDDVDHIVPIHVRPDWRLALANTQVLCRVCHRRKTIADSKRYGASEAVTINDAQRAAREMALQMSQPPDPA